MHNPHDPLPLEPPDDGPDYEVERPAGSLFPFPELRRSDTPVNHGTAWTTAQHELLVDRIRAGDDLDALALAVGRKPGSVSTRLRRLLPPENREHPNDLVVDAVRQYLLDPQADWRGNLLRSTPPRPVINPPPIVRTGVGGIADDDLVTVVHALIATHGGQPPEVLTRLLREIEDRRLTWKLVGERVRDLRYSRDCTMSDVQLIDAAESWVHGVLDPAAGTSSRYADPWAGYRY